MQKQKNQEWYLVTERNTGFEPVTLRAAIERSTTELTAHGPLVIQWAVSNISSILSALDEIPEGTPSYRNRTSDQQISAA